MNVVVLHAEDRTGVRDLVRLHVARMPARAVTRIEDLAVLERERSGVVVGAQDPVRRAVADDGVADGDVVGFAEHAGQRPAPDVEAIEDHVVGLLELDGVRAALQDRPRRAHRTVPAERPRVARRAAVPAADDDLTGVGRAAADPDHVAGIDVDAVDAGGTPGIVAPGGADGLGSGMYPPGPK